MGVHPGERGAEDGHGVEIESVSAGHAVEEHDAASRQHGPQEALLPPDGRLGHPTRWDGRHRSRRRGRTRRGREWRPSLPPDVGLDRVPLLADVRLFAPEPLERFGRFVFPPAQRQAAGRLGDVESGDEQSERSGSDDHGQPPPVEIGAQAETDEQSDVTGHLGQGAEPAADLRRCDLADVDVRDEEDDGRAESAAEGRDVHHCDAISEDGQQPEEWERNGDGQQRPFAAVAHGHAAQRAAKQGAQEG